MGAGGLYAVGAMGGSKDAVAVAHIHGASTGFQSVDHTHSGTTAAAGDHAHSLTLNNTTATGVSDPIAKWSALSSVTATSTANTSNAGNHAHSFTTGGISANHTHPITVNSAGVSGTDANLPPYAAMMLIIKT